MLIAGPLSAMAVDSIPTGCTLRYDVDDETDIAVCVKGYTVDLDENPDQSICCLLDTVHAVTDWVFYFVLILAVLMLVIGGAFYITAAGDPEKAGRGKMILTLSVVGLVIAIIAKLIPSLVRFFVGM